MLNTSSKSNNKIDKEVNKEICEALNCSEYATKVITVDAGKFGPILLSVCANCISKFVNSKY
jgi:hypothetical protein